MAFCTPTYLFSCGWRARHSLVEVYRLARAGIDQADRLRGPGGGSVAHLLVRVDLRLGRAGPLPFVQNEPAGRDGYAHGRADAHVLVDGDLPAAQGSPHRTGSSRRLWIAIPGLNSSSLAGTASRSPGKQADQAAEGFLKLYPGQLSAEAVMHAGAEAQVAGGVAGDVEPGAAPASSAAPAGS